MDITLLAERRKRLGVTQAELARLVHVSRVTVGRWETGESQPIHLAAQWLETVLCRLEAEQAAEAV